MSSKAIEIGKSVKIGDRGWSKLKSLNGRSRAYTIFVLTTVALGIATLYFDVGFLNRDADAKSSILLDRAATVETLNKAGSQIVRALLLLLFCIILSGNAFFLIIVNVYTFRSSQIIRQYVWLILAFISLVVINMFSVVVMINSRLDFDKRRDDHPNYESWFPHIFLLVCLAISTLLMDWLFVAVVFTQNKDELEHKQRSGWAIVRKRLPEIVEMGKPESRRKSYEYSPSLKIIVWDRGVLWIVSHLLVVIDFFIRCVRKILRISEPKAQSEHLATAHRWKNISIDISEGFLSLTDCLAESCLLQVIYSFLRFFTWGMWNPLRTSMAKSRKAVDDACIMQRFRERLVHLADNTLHSWNTFGVRWRGRINNLYEDVREDDKFQHSAWVLAATCTSFVLLVYFGVSLSVMSYRYLNDMYIPRRDCAVASFKNNGELGNFVMRLAGFTENANEIGKAASFIDDQSLTDAACRADYDPSQLISEGGNFFSRIAETQNVPDISLPSGNNSFVEGDDFYLYRCSTETYSENACLALLVINNVEQRASLSLNETKKPIDIFYDHAVGQAIYVFDRVLRNLRWSIWIGLVVGLIVGALSLLSVLAQYKRISLAIRSGFFRDLEISQSMVIDDDEEKAEHIRRVESLITETKWEKLIENYPMGSSAFFFGILVSTAVLQLVVFGFAVSWLSAFAASLFDARVFVILRPYMALVIAFLITWLINGPIAQLVICEGVLVKKYYVHHELLFLLFLLVYTTVHLILGMLFALMRLVWVLLTTTACLNRLDRNLFPIMKQNDVGHRSFMSMILMQHAFQDHAEHGDKVTFSDLYERLRRVQETPAAYLVSRPAQPSSTMSPSTSQAYDFPMGRPTRTISAETALAIYLSEDFDRRVQGESSRNSPGHRLPLV